MVDTAVATAHEPVGYTVKTFLDPVQLKRDISYSTNDLSGAMMQQGSLFVHYGGLYAEAAHQVDVVKMLLESTEATYYKVIRDQFNMSGEKFTETLLEKMVSRTTKVVQMKKALIAAKRIESICKTAMEGFRHRRDMLVQQGLISREEMKGDLYIAERNTRNDAAQAQKESALARIRSQE